ncbi:MAG: hypothetical protein AUI47_08805 [Acidobacteria bacterium 13_1_40CM_2_68_5]|nr:MAG: hypothetical protein AUI47_08805 [Acidobacteria bacterium 13_1_40CM_2_68_5]
MYLAPPGPATPATTNSREPSSRRAITAPCARVASRTIRVRRGRRIDSLSSEEIARPALFRRSRSLRRLASISRLSELFSTAPMRPASAVASSRSRTPIWNARPPRSANRKPIGPFWSRSAAPNKVAILSHPRWQRRRPGPPPASVYWSPCRLRMRTRPKAQRRSGVPSGATRAGTRPYQASRARRRSFPRSQISARRNSMVRVNSPRIRAPISSDFASEDARREIL